MLPPADATVLGLPIVLSAPSGGGKSTIADQVLASNRSLVRSISVTTRAPRNGEKEGVDYFFVDEDKFKKMAENKEFLEWAQVHGSFYGTPVDSFQKRLQQGLDVVLTIDPQGAVAIRRLYPDGVFIFVVPPTWEVLESRLQARKSESPDALKTRLLGAQNELQSLSYYDYLVVNDDLNTAVSDVSAIIRAEHRRTNRINKKAVPFLNRT